MFILKYIYNKSFDVKGCIIYLSLSMLDSKINYLIKS